MKTVIDEEKKFNLLMNILFPLMYRYGDTSMGSQK